jgi:hypothetical protein
VPHPHCCSIFRPHPAFSIPLLLGRPLCIGPMTKRLDECSKLFLNAYYSPESTRACHFPIHFPNYFANRFLTTKTEFWWVYPLPVLQGVSTVFTFQCLDDYLADSQECNTSAYHYNEKLRQLTNSSFPQTALVIQLPCHFFYILHSCRTSIRN